VTACALARAGGAHGVLASDLDPACLERASDFGATHVLTARLEELAAGVADATGGRGADVVLELAGAPTSVAAGLELVRTGGVLILAGTVAPTGNVELNPEKIVRRMLTIRGVHNYHPRDLDAALTFLAGPGRDFPFEKLVAAMFPLEQAEDAVARAHSRPGVRVAVVP
jgi:alcohol dehydrogenase